jgi:hypothetical protein
MVSKLILKNVRMILKNERGNGKGRCMHNCLGIENKRYYKNVVNTANKRKLQPLLCIMVVWWLSRSSGALLAGMRLGM